MKTKQPPRKAKAPTKKATKIAKPTSAQPPQVAPVDVSKDPLPEELENEIIKAEAQIPEIASLSDDAIASAIKADFDFANTQTDVAKTCGRRVVIQAWKIGKMLEIVKGRMKHGKFDSWREEHLVPMGIKERTSQRYLKLVKACPEVRKLAHCVSLKDAYKSFGIQDSAAKERPSKLDIALSAATALDKALRLFIENCGVVMPKVQLQQFIDTLGQVNSAASRLVPDECEGASDPDEQQTSEPTDEAVA